MDKKTVGIKIKQAVKEAGFSSHREFAKKVGIGETMISQWTSGDRNPSVTTLKKIANATGKPLSYFFDNATGVNGNNNIVNTGTNQTVINSSDIELLKKDVDLQKKEMEILKLQMELLKKDKKK
jgi:transcriptional regulator with XRE-family HTH domain